MGGVAGAGVVWSGASCEELRRRVEGESSEGFERAPISMKARVTPAIPRARSYQLPAAPQAPRGSVPVHPYAPFPFPFALVFRALLTSTSPTNAPIAVSPDSMSRAGMRTAHSRAGKRSRRGEEGGRKGCQGRGVSGVLRWAAEGRGTHGEKSPDRVVGEYDYGG